MKQRNIIAVIIFSIITLGIYDLFWLYSTKKELNAKTKVHVPSLWWMFAPAIFLVAAMVVLVIASVASSTSTTGSAGQSASAGLSIVVLLLGIVAIPLIMVIPIWWFLKYSKAVGEYTNGAVSTAVSFLLLWLLRFVGIAVIQDHFNDMIASGRQAAGGPAGVSVPPVAPQPPVNPVPPAPQPPADPAPQPPVPPTDPPAQPPAPTPPVNPVQ